MSPLPSLLLVVGLLHGAGQMQAPPARDVARLREMLHDRLHPRSKAKLPFCSYKMNRKMPRT